jgi:hypothetical protein
MADQSVIEREIGVLNRQLEIVVGLVEFIPEEKVVLRFHKSVIEYFA